MRFRSIIAALCCLAAFPGVARASATQESTFQDDKLLVYGDDPAAIGQTMDKLKALGVDRLRVSVFWKLVAPAPESQDKPAFDASDPAAYPAGAWDRYDRIVRLAQARGLLVNFDVTSPAPWWATGTLPGREDLNDTFDPVPAEFGAFVHAVATRYSGTYTPPAAAVAAAPAPQPGLLPRQAADPAPLPRVDYWTVWNEPNQPGWLTPQWQQDGAAQVETAPRLYRSLMDAMWTSLQATGHGKDTILIGETAPKGQLRVKGPTRAIKPGRFIRQLYCLDDHLQFLKGHAAEQRGCPVSGQSARMAADHPALFRATGYAHHPYELIFAPRRKPKDADDYTTANLGQLSQLLRRIYQRYGQKPAGGRRDVPLYLTEYGYQTSPPDPSGVSLAQQAAYLNEAEWVTSRNPNVKTLTQFLLTDDGPSPGTDPVKDPIDAFGRTFQSGLQTLEGKAKPAMLAYQLPLFLPSRKVRRGTKLKLFGLVRPAANGTAPRVSVQVRSKGASAFETARMVTGTKARGYVNASIVVRRAGAVRLSWTGSGGTLTSRAVSFGVR